MFDNLRHFLMFLVLLCCIVIIVGAALEDTGVEEWNTAWKECGIKGIWHIAPFSTIACVGLTLIMAVAVLGICWVIAALFSC